MLLYIKNGFVLFQNYGKKLEGGWHDDGRASGQVVISFCPSAWKICLPFTSCWALFLSITPTISSGCVGHSLFNLGNYLGNLSFSWLADGEGRRQNSYHCNLALLSLLLRVSLVAQMVKHLPAMRETRVRSLGWEDPLEKEMATHSSILAWRIPWTKEPGGLQSTGSQRVRHDWATSLSLSLCLIKKRPVIRQKTTTGWSLHGGFELSFASRWGWTSVRNWNVLEQGPW